MIATRERVWWQRYLDWLDNGYSSLLYTLLALATVGFFGFWLAVIRPEQVVAARKLEAQVAIDAAISTGTAAGDRYTAEHVWYTPGKGYVDDLDEKLLTAQDDINKARVLLGEANYEPWNPDGQAAKAREARETAEAALALIQEVTTKLDQNKKLRGETRANLATAQDKSNLADAFVAQAEQRFKTEAPQFLAKYTDVYNASLQSAITNRDETHLHLAAANELMPSDEDRGRGDPLAAQAQIDLATTAIQETTGYVGSVLAGLDYQQEALANATPRTKEAEQAYYGVANGDQGAVKYVEAVRQQTGYWLKSSDQSLANALTQLQEAQAYLAAQGPIDHPAAYEAAKSSLIFSQQARSQADNEVATARAANDAIALIATRTVQVTQHINLAASAEQTLRTYHAASTWSSVANNLHQARSNLDAAQQHKERAVQLVALDTQLFADGKTEADAGLTALTNADSLASSIEQWRDALEKWRSQWSSCESTASSAIENARGIVSQYSGYSPSGVSQFNSATSSLSSARSNAAAGYYEQACTDAVTASTQAANAASKAKSDYDDEMDRQRRAREAEAQRQREAAERAREQSQQSPSYDGGYSSGGSGGGYSSGGGGYDSGGGSDYGGGSSDSDY